jgi:glycosyltransferase involved in cell wall biosynthesis
MGKRSGKPVMLIEHGTDHFTVGNKLFDFFGKIYEHILTSIIKRSVDKFYGVSKSCNVWSRHFAIEASGVFYNSIDASDSEKVNDYYQDKYPKGELIITYAGRLIKEKGILNLIEAYRQIDKKSKTRLIVAGDGELFDTLRKKYNDDDIDLVGRLDFKHVMSLYKRTDIFVYPSLYPEGLPTSILEAGLMKCAIIATPKGGTEEVIIDSDHGIIVDGSIESLRAAIDLLVSNSAVRNSQSEKVMKRIKTYFNWDNIAKEVDKEIKGFKLEQS